MPMEIKPPDKLHEYMEVWREWILLPLAIIWKDLLIDILKKTIWALLKPFLKKGEKMLEGKEVEGKFDGDAGSYGVDVDTTGKITFDLGYEKVPTEGLKMSSKTVLEADLVVLLRQAQVKVDNPMFTGAVETIAKMLGR